MISIDLTQIRKGHPLSRDDDFDKKLSDLIDAAVIEGVRLMFLESSRWIKDHVGDSAAREFVEDGITLKIDKDSIFYGRQFEKSGK